jgi:hypothetical protein
MHRRVTVNLALSLALAALFAAGCSRSGDSTAAKAPDKSLADLWARVLTQRDQMHIAFMKPIEDVTHEDCASVGAAGRRMDELFGDLVNVIGAQSGRDAGRLRSLGDVITHASQIVAQVREAGLNEAPGAWPALRYPLDQSLRAIEAFFTADELGNESVTQRPGFETSPLPTPPSPV